MRDFRRWLLPALAVTIGIALFPDAARAARVPHGVDMLPILGALVLMLLGARLGGALFVRFGQSPVLGELLAGILIGNLGLLGWHGLDGLRGLSGLDILAQIGVLFLLFDVGIGTSVRQMMAVGASSTLVATLGVIAPMVLGFFCARAFFPDHSPLADWYVGATLCATSVGITARVLSDLGRADSHEGRIILGAAVIDDVMGLIVLAVVAGVIRAADHGQAFHATTVIAIFAKSLGFLLAAILAGPWVSRGAFRLAARFEGEGWLLSVALAFCFALAWLAGRMGLAPIVGAFAAGLVLDEGHTRDVRDREHGGRGLSEMLRPLTQFLVPVFFVLMGMRVDLAVFARVEILGFAGALTLAAVAGKQACSLGVLEKGSDRLAVGLGMIPRGEVGLILAGIGSTLTLAGERVVDDRVFSAVVVMVALTTLMTPPLLVWRMKRR